ncbi:MAG: metal-dependent hydrolase, partial [Bacilli bacterium]
MMNHGLALWAIGFVIGYVLHLIADFVSGGVPLFYPLGKKRLGFRLVRTGGWTDHAVGAGATCVALATLFL